jgi:predicted site-specific integrase-resolvase
MEEVGISNSLGTSSSSGHLSVEVAATRLGLDPFTVYSFIQRDRLTPILDDEGVFVVSEEEVNQLAQRNKE